MKSKPDILTPSDHPITLEMIDEDALFVLQKLGDNGFGAWLVGGGVRDLYLGKTPKDFDISTDANPGQIKRIFRNSRIIGRRFQLIQLFFKGGKIIEVSTLRSLSKETSNSDNDHGDTLAPNNTFGTLEEDAQRRDLTINSLFYEIKNQTIIDYIGGVSDLDNSIVRFTGEPERRIHRDPVRMIRAIRHAARTGFTIEENSYKAICNNHHKLTLCPTSRLRDEFFKDLQSGALRPWLDLAVSTGILTSLLSIYTNVFSTKSQGQNSHLELLQKISEIIDRIVLKAKENNSKTRIKNDFLIAFFLIPWANCKFDLVNQRLKGAQAFKFGKKTRTHLDKEIGVQLNLRRSIRQEITILLNNLPYFITNRIKGGWPKWLRKKSYFHNCSRFYYLYLEASTNNEARLDFPKEQSSLTSTQLPEESIDTESTKSKRIKPRFTNKSGGVFGLRR